MSEEIQFKLVPGSDYGSKYVVIAQNGPVVLAVKTLGKKCYGHYHCGLRVRSCFDPDANEEQLPVEKQERMDLLNNTWQAIQFTKGHHKRCSVDAEVKFKGTPAEIVSQAEQQNLFEKLIEGLYAALPADQIVVPKEIFLEKTKGWFKAEVTGEIPVEEAKQIADDGISDALKMFMQAPPKLGETIN